MASSAEYALILGIVGAGIAVATLTIGEGLSEAVDDASRPAIEDVRPGQAAFIKPSEMVVGRFYPVEFVAGPTTEALAAQAEDRPLTKPSPIYVSEIMRVILLKDPNFEVNAKSNAIQQMGPDLSSSWQWDVKPKKEGTHTLIAQVDVLKRLADGRFEMHDSYSRRVSVQARVGTVEGLLNGIRNAESVGEALSALFQSWRGALLSLSALLVAGFAVIWTYRKFRRRAPTPADLESGAEG